MTAVWPQTTGTLVKRSHTSPPLPSLHPLSGPRLTVNCRGHALVLQSLSCFHHNSSFKSTAFFGSLWTKGLLEEFRYVAAVVGQLKGKSAHSLSVIRRDDAHRFVDWLATCRGNLALVCRRVSTPTGQDPFGWFRYRGDREGGVEEGFSRRGPGMVQSRGRHHVSRTSRLWLDPKIRSQRSIPAARPCD